MVDDCYALSLEYAKVAKDVPVSMFPITVAKQPMYKAKNRLKFETTGHFFGLNKYLSNEILKYSPKTTKKFKF